MICPRCLLRASRRALRSHPTQTTRGLTTTPTSLHPQQAVSSANPTQSSPPLSSPPPATSTFAAQPSSAPLTPLSTPKPKPPSTSSAHGHAIPVSSCPAGTVLKGLNYHKNKQDPVAMEDDEYPEWLWSCLEDKRSRDKDGEGGGGEGDMFSKSKKQRRLAAKRQRKMLGNADPATLAPKIPIYEQSIDLPAGDGTVEGALAAVKSRVELNRAMREKRREKIKESNFLKGMR